MIVTVAAKAIHDNGEASSCLPHEVMSSRLTLRLPALEAACARATAALSALSGELKHWESGNSTVGNSTPRCAHNRGARPVFCRSSLFLNEFTFVAQAYLRINDLVIVVLASHVCLHLDVLLLAVVDDLARQHH